MSVVDREPLAGLRRRLAPLVAEARGQIEANRRLALALAVIPAILWLYLLLAGRQTIDDMRQKLGQSRDRLARVERIAADESWTKRREASDVMRAQLENRLWPIETEGIARTEFQEWVLAAARSSGLARPTARVEPTEQAQPKSGFRPITATLSADFAAPALEAFLAKIADADRLIAVDTLRVQEQPVPRVDIRVTTYGQTQTHAPAPERAPARAVPGPDQP